MTVIIVYVVTVMLFIWLLLCYRGNEYRSQIWGRNVTLFGSDCDSGVSAGIGVIHTAPKSGGEKVTLFGSDCDGSVNSGMWVVHTGHKSGGEKVTLFGIDCYDGVSAGIGVIHYCLLYKFD